jgi:hypothetical protein
MGKLVSRKEAGDVPGTVCAQVITDPVGDGHQIIRRIIQPRDYVGSGFNMYTQFLRTLNALQHIANARFTADTLVKRVIHALDV